MRKLLARAAVVYAAISGVWTGARAEMKRTAASGASATAPRPFGWKRWALTAAAILLVFGIVGAAAMISGAVPIKASSGHWAVTKWLLEFSMRRSVTTYSTPISAPPLEDRALVVKGAGQYVFACEPCHGRPDLRHPRVAAAMLPQPPYLPTETPNWENDELFYIVKHGVKFTGMPAWPTLRRDDEVWAMVAFLRRFEQMDSGEYQQLAHGPAPQNANVPADVPEVVQRDCAKCHGFDGLGRGAGAYPKLAGQTQEYLASSLAAFARGERHSGVMEPRAAQLSDEELREVVRYYASLPRADHPEAAAFGDVARGEAIARDGIPEKRVPACSSCHGPTDAPRNPHYPVLSGQYPQYLVLQLELFKHNNRGGTEYSHLMRHVAGYLTPEQMRDVAAYFASLQTVRPGASPGRE